DYMPIAYCDIDADTVTGTNADGKRMQTATNDVSGALGFCRKIGEVSDGMSNTVLVIEDANRPTSNSGKYDTTAIYIGPLGTNGIATGVGLLNMQSSLMYQTSNSVSGQLNGNFGGPGRWADPDSGSGVSGPPNQTAGGGLGYINQNRIPFGGPTACPWATN